MRVFPRAGRSGALGLCRAGERPGGEFEHETGMDKEQKAKVVEEYGRGEGDTGSPEVQVALLTERITRLTDHLRTHKRDFSTRRGLLKLVGQRTSLLRYLSREDEGRYNALIGRLGLRR
jgi:small subunit ribosomal protein S15